MRRAARPAASTHLVVVAGRAGGSSQSACARSRDEAASLTPWQTLPATPAQVERERELAGCRSRRASAARPACGRARRTAPARRALGLVGVHREVVVAAAARMGDVVRAAAERALGPRVDDVEDQRRVHGDGRMQAATAAARRGSARRRTNSPSRAGRLQRHAPAVAGDDVSARPTRPLAPSPAAARPTSRRSAPCRRRPAPRRARARARAPAAARARCRRSVTRAVRAGSGTRSAARTTRARTR